MKDMINDTVYLDNAATTYPKPNNVKACLSACLDGFGNPGRSSHSLSVNSAKLIYSCRELICAFFGISNPENVVFTYNTTYALNMAINVLCPQKGKIIISNLEHNSVLRPVHNLCQKSCGALSYKVFDALSGGESAVSAFEAALTGDTVMAVITMCSNVTGTLLPIKRISEICRQKKIILILDAAQCAGICDINLGQLYYSAVCFAGHKSLYGIMGSGFCIFSKDVSCTPWVYGGNGIYSLHENQDGVLPELLEAGTLGVPSIAALKEGIKHVASIGIPHIYGTCTHLEKKLSENLSNMEGIVLYNPSKYKVGTVLFNLKGYDSEKLSAILSRNGICVRGGFHCSSLAHKALGTVDAAGAVRVSFSHFNTEVDIVRITDVLHDISRSIL